MSKPTETSFLENEKVILRELAKKVEALEKELTLLNDAREIANLQGRYIYYLQAHQYDQIVEMFARHEKVSIEMDNLGKFIRQRRQRMRS